MGTAPVSSRQPSFGCDALEQSELATAHDRLGSIAHRQLAVDVAGVPFNSAQGDEEPLSDFLVSETFGDKGQNLNLAVA